MRILFGNVTLKYIKWAINHKCSHSSSVTDPHGFSPGLNINRRAREREAIFRQPPSGFCHMHLMVHRFQGRIKAINKETKHTELPNMDLAEKEAKWMVKNVWNLFAI